MSAGANLIATLIGYPILFLALRNYPITGMWCSSPLTVIGHIVENNKVVTRLCNSSKLLYDWRSVSMSWYRAPLWDLRPDITSCRNTAVWNLRSCFCGAPSLTRGRSAIYNVITQWSESRKTRNHTLLSLLRHPQPRGPGSRIYIPQEQGGQVIPLGTGFYVIGPAGSASKLVSPTIKFEDIEA
jgi:hypothetical protein